MSVLDINDNNFEIHYGDLIQHLELYINVKCFPRNPHHEWKYATEKMKELEEAIRAVPKPKLNGRDVRRIIKSVLGVDLSVRLEKIEYTKGLNVYQYFIFKDPNPTFEVVPSFMMSVEIPGTKFELVSIRMNVKMNIVAPHDKFKY